METNFGRVIMIRNKFMQSDLVLLIWPTVAEGEKLVKIQWFVDFPNYQFHFRSACVNISLLSREH